MKGKKTILLFSAIFLCTTIAIGTILNIKYNGQTANEYVEWFCANADEYMEDTTIIAYVNEMEITASELKTYSMLHSIDVAYHEKCSPEVVYLTDPVMQASFFEILQGKIYQKYLAENNLDFDNNLCLEYINQKISADLHSSYANLQATAAIKKMYYSCFEDYFCGVYAQYKIQDILLADIDNQQVMSEKALELYTELMKRYDIMILPSAPAYLRSDEFLKICLAQNLNVVLQ